MRPCPNNLSARISELLTESGSDGFNPLPTCERLTPNRAQASYECFRGPGLGAALLSRAIQFSEVRQRGAVLASCGQNDICRYSARAAGAADFRRADAGYRLHR